MFFDYFSRIIEITEKPERMDCIRSVGGVKDPVFQAFLAHIHVIYYHVGYRNCVHMSIYDISMTVC
jgi:hypothetical protein